jgi:hypothetical protein
MATGIQLSDSKRGTIVRLLENVGAATGKPADGTPPNVLRANPTATQFFAMSELGLGSVPPEGCSLRIYETAGSGALSIAYARLWVYDIVAQKAFPAGIGADADKGKLNNGAAFGITDTAKLRHTEPLLFLDHCDGIQCELGTIAGTTPTFNVDLFIPRGRR